MVGIRVREGDDGLGSGGVAILEAVGLVADEDLVRDGVRDGLGLGLEMG